MNKYEVMAIIKSGLTEEERKAVLGQINDVVTKYGGKVTQSSIWAERKKLTFRIGKSDEGAYYLLNFSMDPKFVKDLREAYRLNENILRSLITVGK